MRCGWLLLFASACSFGVHGVAVAPNDLSDAGAGGDLGMPGPTDDLGADAGGNGGGDLAMPPGPTPLQLSHVPQHYLTDGTCDLTVASAIDTSAHTVDGAAPPAGCVFEDADVGNGRKVAVLAVRSLTTSGTVKVTGGAPLAIVAGAGITIGGLLDGSADHATPGPGGASPGMGDGAGPDGKHAGAYSDSGGDGASYAVAGGVGGKGSYNGQDATSDPARAAYGTADLKDFVFGGSGGGKGASETANTPGGVGGAGGGSIQLSAGASITISAAGAIDVGGGGGGGGAEGNGGMEQGSGGGGGSGGAIFLEAPTVSVAGGLWANGGSGGGGGSGLTVVGPGKPGNNGPMAQMQAAPGMTGGTYGGDGGKGGSDTAPDHGGEGGLVANGGGGGGSAGRIVVRSRGAATLDTSKVSPAAYLDATIP